MVIAKIAAYRATYKFHHSHGNVTASPKYVIRATLRGAASKIAWWMIEDKYLLGIYGLDIKNSLTITYRPAPRGLVCECDAEEALYGGDPWSECPLHNRVNGYYKRVHDRLADYIMSTIEATEEAKQ